MNEPAFDAFVRRAANALDRRSLLGVLTGAMLTAAVDPLATDAKKKKKKKNKKDEKKDDKKQAACLQQAADCRAGSEVYCKNKHCCDDGARALCLAQRSNCCDLYAACDESGGNACIFNMV